MLFTSYIFTGNSVYCIYIDTAYCKRTEENGEEKWYNFDDACISEIKEKDVVVREVIK